MSEFVEIIERVVPLVVPVVLGVACARARLIGDLRSGIAALNVFALYFGFPALIVSGLIRGDFLLPTEVGFWLAIPLSVTAIAGMARLMSRGERSSAGTLALVGLFGNVAYLGLPFCIAVFGDEYAGVCSLAVSIHVAIAVSVGPVLLVRWSGAEGRGDVVRRVLRQPLFWAPFVGILLRLSPAASAIATPAVVPLGQAAAPVALFMLGLYLYDRRAEMRRPAPAHVFLVLGLSPALTALIVLGLHALGLFGDLKVASILVVLASMPAAITTFSIAHDAGADTDRVAATIVQSTLVAIVTLPVVALIALSLS
ncbi:MAG: putative permease [Bradymonadia bacterium]|jgi:predicted permease